MPAIVEKGKGALTHKIGPLPLWGWVVAGAAAVFVVKKVGGHSSGGGSFSGSIPIASLAPGASSSVGDGSLASGGSAVGSPNQNVQGGSDTQIGGTAPWWATKPGWWDAVPGALKVGGPSTNGSAGSGSDKTPKDAPKTDTPPPPWWTRLTSALPIGNASIPPGAAVTTIGGTNYSLSDAALTRSQITGSSPIQPTAPKGATADVPPSGNQPWSRFENI